MAAGHQNSVKLKPQAQGEVKMNSSEVSRFCAVVFYFAVLVMPAVAVPTDILKTIGLSMPSVERGGSPEKLVLLNDTWKFNPSPVSAFWQKEKFGIGWSDIDVPGEWIMQGFEVAAEKAAGYTRKFDLPKNWKDNRIKLRFDAVFSVAEVYVNGRKAGRHEGGFTPFEIDITDKVNFGSENTLSLEVTSESLSDRLASASKYAVHALGGISRKVSLFAVPRVNINSYHITTEFDEAFDNATMNVAIKINNQGSKNIQGAKMKFSLLQWPGRELVNLKGDLFRVPDIAAGKMLRDSVEIKVDSPEKWDSEHPNLYILQCEIIKDSKIIQRVERRFGFREVEVRGNQLYVNNRPVKLRASNRHECHPLRGRSLTMEQWRTDVLLFREANCNLLRTSHYPPADELIDMCDELGMFVELESAICWVRKLNANVVNTATELICRQMLEGVEVNKSHPSIIIWSLGNESGWNVWFQNSYEIAMKYDSSRPFSFHDQHGDNRTDIMNDHYAGPNGPKRFANSPKPVWFGEYVHLNAYNRYELWTDPGVRNAWGRGFKAMWESMYATESILGGAIWAGIDDTFFLPSGHTVGYGTWGPIDGWRRKKPEFWHVKKVYSPVRINARYLNMPADLKTIKIPVENRFNFTNLKELVISWRIGDKSGKAVADIGPRSAGQIVIHPGVPSLKGGIIELQFKSPLGFIVDKYALPIGKPAPVLKAQRKESSEQIAVKENVDEIQLTADTLVLKFSKKTGMISDLKKGDMQVVNAGPELMVLALNKAGDTQMTKAMKAVTADTSVRSGRKIESVSAVENGSAVSISVKESYDIAKGGYKLTLKSNGEMAIDYEYEMTADINPRQYGMVMTLPGSYNKLSWKRRGLWSVYPQDHIARLKGEAKVFVGSELSGIAGPSAKPDYQWRHDTNELGTADFRSTKENIFTAALSGHASVGFVVNSDGTQHLRCWAEGDAIRMLVAEYNNPGAERFFRRHAVLEDKPLKKGSKISGSLSITLSKPKRRDAFATKM